MVIALAASGCDEGVAVPDDRPPLNATAFADPDVLSFGDPNAFDSVTAFGADSTDMFDQRTGTSSRTAVWSFEASYDDGISTQIRINAEFDSASAAQVADDYAHRIGFLPAILREGIDTLHVHDGSGAFLASGRTLLVHTDEGEEHRLQGALEEVLAHEAVHLALDADHAASSGWLEAQASDPVFISGVARDAPVREDLAETFVVWLAVRWAPEQITGFLTTLITQAVPARLDYLDAQAFDMHPLQ